MKNSINKKLPVFALVLLFFGSLNAQKQDAFVQELLKQRKWFVLDKEYPLIKDSIEDPVLKLITESLLNIKFNQSNAAISSIDILLNKYQEKFGFKNCMEFFRYKISLLDYQGEYKFIAEELESFMNQTSGFLPQEELEEFKKMYDFFNLMRNEEKTQIIKPEKDIEIPLGKMEMEINIEKNDSIIQEPKTTTLGVVKISIQGRDYVFILDTGFERTCIFSKTSKNINLRYLTDPVNIIGVGTCQGELALLDTISLGEVRLSNLLVVVADNFMAKKNISGNVNIDEYIHGVIGADVLKRMGEIQIRPNDKKIIVPQNESQLPVSGRNIILDDNNYIIVKALNGDDIVSFHLDTGNSNSNMLKSYYSKNQNEIETTLEKKNNFLFGVGDGIKSNTFYQKPSFTLFIGDTSFTLNNIPIYTENAFIEDPNADGSLGMDFIYNFSEITLNLNKMFIQLKK